MIELVISGGQTGADQAGWRAAKAAGFRTSGVMPKGFRTEGGPRPDFARAYGAIEHESPLYPPRTRENADLSDATIWFGDTDSAGYGCTISACRKLKRPFFRVPPKNGQPIELATWLRSGEFQIINIAGHRESTHPGIGAWVEKFLSETFRILKEQQ